MLNNIYNDIYIEKENLLKENNNLKKDIEIKIKERDELILSNTKLQTTITELIVENNDYKINMEIIKKQLKEKEIHVVEFMQIKEQNKILKEEQLKLQNKIKEKELIIENFEKQKAEKVEKVEIKDDKTFLNGIPKVIYMCHYQYDMIKYFSENWKRFNPDFEIKLFDNRLCEEFLHTNFSSKYADIFRYIRDGPIKADFWRVCVLYKNGGVYIDADIEPLLPIKDFIVENVDFVTSFDYLQSFNPHFIISNANDELLKYCIDKYVSFYDTKHNYTYDNWSITSIFNSYFNGIGFRERNIDNVYTIRNKKYQFFKEVWPRSTNNLSDVFCRYKNIRVFNNRYRSYDPNKHNFKTNLPLGSWINSAKNYRVENGILYADLLKENGSLNSSLIKINPNEKYMNKNGEFQKE